MPYAVLADAAAASLLAAGEVDMVLTGADRVAADGSVANKIGTYGLAVLARHHGVPFVVAAPLSTVDFTAPDGRGDRGRAPAGGGGDVVRLAAVVAPAEQRRLQPRVRRHPRRAGDRAGDRTADYARRPSAGTLHFLGAARTPSRLPPPVFPWNDEVHERSRAGRR